MTNYLIVFSNPEKLPELRIGLKGKRRVLEEFTSSEAFVARLNEASLLTRKTLVILDGYLELPYPTAPVPGPEKLNADHPSMRLIQLIRKMKPQWRILLMTHEGSLNDGTLALELGADNWHTTDVSKWYSRILLNAVALAFRATHLDTVET